MGQVKRITWACLTVAVLLPWNGPARAADVDIGTVLKAWRVRQSRVKTAEFEWTEQGVITKGSISARAAAEYAKARKKAPAEGIPSKDVVFNLPSSLSLDGSKLRCERESLMWSAEKNQLVPQSALSVFDGKESVLYHGIGGIMRYPQAVIRREKQNVYAGIYYNRAILINYRPDTFSMSRLAIGQLRILNQKAVLPGGAECLLVEGVSSSPDERSLCWVDPNRDYVIAKYTEESAGRVHFKLDLSYTQDKEFGWIPSGWDLVWTGGNATIRASVTKYAINRKIDISRFRVTFPAGTRVTDMVSNPSSDYIVKEGGKIRNIPREDIGATYEQMLNSEPGEALRMKPEPRSVRWWWIGGVFAAGIACLVVIWFRRRRVAPAPGSAGPQANGTK